MQTEPAFTETELAQRWNISIKMLHRWRSEDRGPPYIKLSKAVRYRVRVLHDVDVADLLVATRLAGRVAGFVC